MFIVVYLLLVFVVSFFSASTVVFAVFFIAVFLLLISDFFSGSLFLDFSDGLLSFFEFLSFSHIEGFTSPDSHKAPEEDL